ncbi:hypothetical protein MEM_02626 [Candida albicans L26]|nr:hypothetical protein MEO_02592 [Candida albicans P94015]KGU12649.1 hypothetical protein MEM_02626 [Candida albicans L26]KHC64566.1 hypothetical protein MGE_02619 [Candida albicans P75010]KHC79477.1 hypothetical protein MGS_02610 [Candida albicans P78042]
MKIPPLPTSQNRFMIRISMTKKSNWLISVVLIIRIGNQSPNLITNPMIIHWLITTDHPTNNSHIINGVITKIPPTLSINVTTTSDINRRITISTLLRSSIQYGTITDLKTNLRFMR